MSAPLSASVGAGGGHGLWEALSQAKGGDPLAPVTVVAPSAYAAVARRRRLALEAHRAGARGVAAVTFTTSDHLARLVGAPVLAAAGLRPAPSAVEAETIRAVAAGGPGSWPRLAAHPRTLVALQRAFAELRQLSASELEVLASRRLRGSDVVALLLAVRRELHGHGFADTIDVRQAALSAASGSAPLALETGALVVLEPGPMAPWAASFLEWLGRRSACLTVASPSPGAAGTTATERWACADPEEEARTAVRLVLAGAEDGVALWRQALLHPPGEGYARLLHQQLAAAGVAANGPELRRLDRTSAGRALLGLLELAGGHFARGDVLAWLSSAPLRTAPGGRPVPVSRWNALSAAAGVVRGRAQWAERLARLGARQQADAEEAAALAGFVEDLAQRTGDPGRRWSARAAWAAALLEHYLDPGDPGPGAVDGPAGPTATAGSEALWPEEQRTAYVQVLEAVRALADLDAVTASVDLAGFRRAVRAELERHHLDTAELSGGGVGDGVFVAPFTEGRAMPFDTVVLVGFSDAEVPGRSGEDALVPEELRAADGSGALRTRSRRQAELFCDAGAALAAGERRRVVTWPAIDPRSGRAQVPSRFLEELSEKGAPLRHVASFAASLGDSGPALDTADFTLRCMSTWAGGGGDVLESAPAQLDARLRLGLEALRARAGARFTRFDGLVGPGRVSPFDPARPVSATRLETYAECPRKFLFQKVLGIEARLLPEDLWRIEGRDRGSLVHAVLERYVAERIGGAPRSLRRLLEIADDHMDDMAAGGMVGKALLWRLDRAAIVRDLRTFYSEEGDLVPLAAELAFGDKDGELAPVTVTLPDGRAVLFRGRADRVDRGPEGELVVSDYKTGRQRSISKLGDDPLDGGKRLQLPLYALAARQAFGAGPVRARYWMVSGERSAVSYGVELDDALERHFTDVVGRIARAVDEGLFPAIPGPPRDGTFEGCAWCDFDVVCSPLRDRQWAAKRGAPVLAAVDDLLAVSVGEPLSASLVRT